MKRPTDHGDDSVLSWWIGSIQYQVPPGLLTDTLFVFGIPA